ncbi:MAG: DMT family transporter [Planctomycetota bacterium]
MAAADQHEHHTLRDTLVAGGFVTATLACWSITPVMIRYLASQTDIDPWTQNGWRYGFAALIWLPVLVIAASRKRLPSGLLKAAVIPAVVNALGQVAFVFAFYHTTAPMVSIGLRSQMVCVAIGAAIFFTAERRLITRPSFLGALGMVLVGIIGVLVLGGEASFEELDGFVYALLAGAGYAFYSIAIRHYMQGVKPALAFAAVSQYTAIIMLALMFIFAGLLSESGERTFGGDAFNLTPKAWAVMLGSSIIGIAVGHVVFYTSIARLGVAVASGVVQTQPIWIALLSWLILDEAGLSPVQWIGGGIAIAGAVLMLVIQHRTRMAESKQAKAQAAERN